MADSQISSSTRQSWLVALVLTALLIAVVIRFVHDHQPTPTPVRTSHVDESDIADYVGDTACEPCHSSEFQQHKASSHARALRPMTRAALGDQLPAPGRINNSQYAFLEQDGKFYFEVNVPGRPDEYQRWPLDYAFGSGQIGISYVSMLEGHNVVEMKMSYFPRQGIWRVTPGQKLDNPAAAGNLGNLLQSRKCLSCHVVAMSKHTYTPRPEFMGVGCESCHGPGRAHIAAVKNHANDLHMPQLDRMSARDLNDLCGKCHQTAQVRSTPLLAKMTFRFEPWGLMKSRCFRDGGGRLSCLNCHDAHTDASTDRESYTAACLSCHSSSAQSSLPTAQGGHTAKVCPVNARTQCVSCHMPRRDILSPMNEVSGLYMTEHRIAIYPDTSPVSHH